MKIRKLIIMLTTLLPALAMAQYNGGNGRGDFLVKYLPCANPTYAGKISTSQEICSGTVPDTLRSDSAAFNYGGDLQYQWQQSVTGSSSGFSIVSGATGAGYLPSALTQTCWYRRLAQVACKNDWGSAVISNVVKITIDEVTVGGSVSGDTLVCYGSQASVLTLSGKVGTILKWQYSTNGTVWNDTAHTAATYTATNLIADTWYRAVVKSGVCLTEYSASHKVKVFADYRISGYAKYENNPKTPLTGVKIFLRKGSAIVDSVVTNAQGHYEFDNLTNGTFGLVVKSAHPSGQWQTWGGVNNTDYMLALRHATTGPLLPGNPPVVRISGDVKAPQTPPVITTVDADAIRMAAKYGWGPVNKPYFDIPKWVFSGLNNGTRIDSIVLTCGNQARDIRGLCAGDVNGSYLPPNGYKMAEPSLELVNRGTLPITPEITFPVRAERDMELGAITLMLDYDPSLLEITGVEMPENGGVEPWFLVQSSKFKVGKTPNLEPGTPNLEPETPNLEPGTLNILQIGWASLNPVYVSRDEIMLLIHARPSSLVPRPSSLVLSFTLNNNPLSELADGNGMVVDGAKLSIADASENGKTVKWQNGKVVCYPNPAHATLNLELETTSIGTLNLELVNLHGVSVMKCDMGVVEAGWHKNQLNTSNLAPGVYFLRANMNGEIINRKLIISR